ncbi:MAG: zinc-dependent alcohol dehydrogenase family protein [Candidatus Krumholzibacteriia bacterium]
MRAMVLDRVGSPLQLRELPEPAPGPGEVLLAVHACGVCRTDLHVVDGDLPDPRLPLVPGHQVVGTVLAMGPDADRLAGAAGADAAHRGADAAHTAAESSLPAGLAVGDRVGVPWLGGSCGRCRFCREGRENLCAAAVYTGYQRDGGFGERCVADARYCFPLPGGYPDSQVAPLLCAGLIGYRSYRMAGPARRLGFYGFGAAAHIIIQLARHEGREVHAFSRPGDLEGQAFARDMGAVWAGGSDEKPPQPLDAAIIFAPVGALVPAALAAVERGGTVVCAGIHMSDIPAFPYSLLWEERRLVSVANLTRRDGEEFLALAPGVPVRTRVHPYPLERANDALDDLRHGRFEGAAVIVVQPEPEQESPERSRRTHKGGEPDVSGR